MAGNYSNTGSWVPGVHSVGLRNVGSYQVSGTPWMTGSNALGNTDPANLEHEIAFPYVAQQVIVRNCKFTGGKWFTVAFQLASAGNVISNKHYVTLSPNETYVFNSKCTKIFLRAETTGKQVIYEVLASLTNIPVSSMYTLTGSGITE